MVLELRPRFLAATVAVLATVACGPTTEESESTADSSPSGDAHSSTGDGETGEAATCANVCPAVLEAACTGGPVDMADCESGCAYSGMTCPVEWTAVLNCLTSASEFACDASGRVTSPGCESQYDALYMCLGVP
jgi:hypothetical protein